MTIRKTAWNRDIRLLTFLGCLIKYVKYPHEKMSIFEGSIALM